MQKWQYPIHNGTLKTALSENVTDIVVFIVFISDNSHMFPSVEMRKYFCRETTVEFFSSNYKHEYIINT